VAIAVVSSLLNACNRAEPPGAEIDASQSTPLLPISSALASSVAVAYDAARTQTGRESPANVDPGRLPQTEERPIASGTAFDARVRALWNAIVLDEPEAAMPFFFPLGAYEQVKDVADPEGDWRHRLLAAYRRDIHALHARLGEDASSAQLVRIDVPDSRARWVQPGEEWNRIGYFRVFGSRLRYLSDGNERSFDVKSLISWRGDWYVVHLSAIK